VRDRPTATFRFSEVTHHEVRTDVQGTILGRAPHASRSRSRASTGDLKSTSRERTQTPRARARPRRVPREKTFSAPAERPSETLFPTLQLLVPPLARCRERGERLDDARDHGARRDGNLALAASWLARSLARRARRSRSRSLVVPSLDATTRRGDRSEGSRLLVARPDLPDERPSLRFVSFHSFTVSRPPAHAPSTLRSPRRLVVDATRRASPGTRPRRTRRC
jgi:hypothetical protein